MEIISKSLHHSNIVFVFEEKQFSMPDNSSLMALYPGQITAGANFADDAVLRTKVLDLPKLKLQIVVEPTRLIIEDNSQEEPGNSSLIQEAASIFQKLFPQNKLIGFGFNFDIYCQFRDVIRTQDLFHKFAEPDILEKSDLRDFGFQFTLEKEAGKKREQYFIKITAPLEVVVHVNHHFWAKELPVFPLTLGASLELDKDRAVPLQKLFEKCYDEIDRVIQSLKF